MRTTFRQPPNMKGKKHYAFRCGCCWARNCRDQESEREAMKQATSDIVDNQERLGDEFEDVLFGDLWELYAR